MRALISVWDKTGWTSSRGGSPSSAWSWSRAAAPPRSSRKLGLAVTRSRADRVPGDARRPRQDAPPADPRRHPGAARGGADEAALAEHGIEPFDLVCVNLYPFEQVARERGVREEEAVEMIDIGGPSMLRGAAKNFAHVAPVCRTGGLRARARRAARARARLARDAARPRGDAFATSAGLRGGDRDVVRGPAGVPRDAGARSFEKQLDLAYGENPHQAAAYYAERGARTHLLARVEQLHGRELSFNNLNDLNAARLLLREFTLPACVIVKHANPCGVAVGASIEEAYEPALAGGSARPTAASSCSTAPSRRARRAARRAVRRGALRAGYDEPRSRRCVAQAADADPERPRAPRLRAVRARLQARARRPPRAERDWDVADREGMEVVAGQPSEGLGRSALRLAGLQARDLERDRARARTCRRSGSAPAR